MKIKDGDIVKYIYKGKVFICEAYIKNDGKTAYLDEVGTMRVFSKVDLKKLSKAELLVNISDDERKQRINALQKERNQIIQERKNLFKIIEKEKKSIKEIQKEKVELEKQFMQDFSKFPLDIPRKRKEIEIIIETKNLQILNCEEQDANLSNKLGRIDYQLGILGSGGISEFKKISETYVENNNKEFHALIASMLKDIDHPQKDDDMFILDLSIEVSEDINSTDNSYPTWQELEVQIKTVLQKKGFVFKKYKSKDNLVIKEKAHTLSDNPNDIQSFLKMKDEEEKISTQYKRVKFLVDSLLKEYTKLNLQDAKKAVAEYLQKSFSTINSQYTYI